MNKLMIASVLAIFANTAGAMTCDIAINNSKGPVFSAQPEVSGTVILTQKAGLTFKFLNENGKIGIMVYPTNSSIDPDNGSPLSRVATALTSSSAPSIYLDGSSGDLSFIIDCK